MESKRIMIVEDEHVVALGLQETLELSNYQVGAVARTGDEAIQKATEVRPDLVLMDIQLKGSMDGVEAATRIRQNLDIPIIYLTAYSDESTLKRAKVAEPFGYLLKPFEQQALHTAIETALHKHQMDKKVKQSEEWLNSVLRGTAEAIIVADATGRLTFMNPTAEVITGWTSQDARGKPWWDCFRLQVESDSGQQDFQIAEETLNGPSSLPHNSILLPRDNKPMPVDGSISPTRDNHGRVAGYVFALRDVSSRKRLENALQKSNQELEHRVQERTEKLSQANKALRESETRFRSISESATDGILVMNGEGEIIYANKSVLHLLCYAEDELLKKKIELLVPERCRGILNEAVQRLADDKPVRFGDFTELVGLDKAGREFPVEFSVSTWKKEKDRFYAVILRDITERRMHESNLKFQANVLSQVKDAVVVTNDEGRIAYWNNGAESLYGFRPALAIGEKLAAVVDGDWLPAETELAVQRALEEEGEWHGEVAQRNKTGGDIYVEMSISRLLAPGPTEQGGRLMVVRDVTERKQLQGMLIHSEKLAAMGQMAAGIAHELKTPLGVIFGFADLNSRNCPEGGPLRKALDTIKKQVLRCTRLVDNLLDFARKQRPKELRPVDLKDVVQAALALVEPHAMPKSVRIKKEFAPESLRVLGAKEMLEQVVINLCLNAIDAMPGGGALTIKTMAFDKKGAPWSRLDVVDTGAGIPAEIQDKIFEPFFTTKGPGKGTGLGVWLCKEIVTSVGGEITCDSTVGKGATFHVEFPLMNDQTPLPGPSAAEK